MIPMDADRNERIARVIFSYEDQTKLPVVSCNLCGESYFTEIAHIDRYGFPITACACNQCGLIFLNPRMSSEAYANFYESVYRPLVSAYHGRLINSETIQNEQAAYADAWIKFAGSVIQASQGAHLLDIGGSTGVVAQPFADQFGCKVTVLDPSPDELQVARDRGFTTIAGLVEDIDFRSQQYEMILLCQTIDHLLDIAGTLSTIRKLLTPGGFFFVDIVDFRAGYLRNWSIEEALKIDHPYYLTEESAEAFLKTAGFNILKKGYAADRLHIAFLCQKGHSGTPFTPGKNSTDQLLREIRLVQNQPRFRRSPE